MKIKNKYFCKQLKIGKNFFSVEQRQLVGAFVGSYLRLNVGFHQDDKFDVCSSDHLETIEGEIIRTIFLRPTIYLCSLFIVRHHLFGTKT